MTRGEPVSFKGVAHQVHPSLANSQAKVIEKTRLTELLWEIVLVQHEPTLIYWPCCLQHRLTLTVSWTQRKEKRCKRTGVGRSKHCMQTGCTVNNPRHQ